MRGIFRSLGEGEDRNVLTDNSADPSANATVITNADMASAVSTPLSPARPSDVVATPSPDAVSTITAPGPTPILLSQTIPVAPAAVDPSLIPPAAVPTASASSSSSFPVGLAVIAGLIVVVGGIYYFGKKK